MEGFRSRGGRSRLGSRSVVIVLPIQHASSEEVVATQAPRVMGCLRRIGSVGIQETNAAIRKLRGQQGTQQPSEGLGRGTRT